MIKKRRKQLIIFYILSDLMAIIFAFNMTYWLRFKSNLIAAPKGIPNYHNYLIIIPILILVHMVHFSYQGYYKIKLRRNRLDDLFLVFLNTIVSAFLILLIFSYFKSYQFFNFEVSHIFLLVYIPFGVAFIFCQRLLVFKFFKSFYLKRNGVSRVLIAGTGELALLTAENLRKYTHFGIEVTGFLNPNQGEGILGDYSDLEAVAKKYSITDLVIALPSKEYETTMKLIENANNLMIELRVVPDIIQMTSLKVGMEHIEGIPVINLGDIPLQGWQLFFKRGFDLLVGFLGVFLFFPFFVIIALSIKLTSKGSIFYIQKRVGLDGRHFNMIKFRTMIENAEKDTGAIWSPPNDSRVTKIGRVLRKLSLDEIPQLLNVIAGNMSLVGPRPERPELVEKFRQKIPNYMIRHSVKTGMTGWAQVHGLRGNTSLDKRIEFDIYYIQNWSFRLDLEILWRTLLKFQFIDTNI